MLGYAIKGKRKAYKQSSMHKALSNNGYIKVEVWYPNLKVAKTYYWEVKDCKYINPPIWNKEKQRFAWVDEESYDNFIKQLEPFIALADEFYKQVIGQIWTGNPISQETNNIFSTITILE